MTTMLFLFLIAVVGLLIFFAAKDTKQQDVGKIMFFCGLLALLMRVTIGRL